MKYQCMVLGNYTAWDQGSWTASAKSTTKTEFILDRQEIASLAYCYWIERGCPCGSPEKDWLRAEVEVRVRIASPAAERRANVELWANKSTLAAGA